MAFIARYYNKILSNGTFKIDPQSTFIIPLHSIKKELSRMSNKIIIKNTIDYFLRSFYLAFEARFFSKVEKT